MKCPKYLEYKLLQRAKYAEKILLLNCEIDKWLEKNNIDTEYMYSHCMIYTEPRNGAYRTIEAIESEKAK